MIKILQFPHILAFLKYTVGSLEKKVKSFFSKLINCFVKQLIRLLKNTHLVSQLPSLAMVFCDAGDWALLSRRLFKHKASVRLQVER